ncbi:hypothetical protein Pmar_PMAR002758, partial [Perkinsus marinus ATCC 50983]
MSLRNEPQKHYAGKTQLTHWCEPGVEKKPSHVRVYGRGKIECVDRLLVCTSMAAAIRCGVEGLSMEGGTDGLRVDYVPSTSDAVLTVPPRCDAMDLEALVWDKLRPKEVRVVMTKEVSSTRGEDGIV